MAIHATRVQIEALIEDIKERDVAIKKARGSLKLQKEKFDMDLKGVKKSLMIDIENEMEQKLNAQNLLKTTQGELKSTKDTLNALKAQLDAKQKEIDSLKSSTHTHTRSAISPLTKTRLSVLHSPGSPSSSSSPSSTSTPMATKSTSHFNHVSLHRLSGIRLNMNQEKQLVKLQANIRGVLDRTRLAKQWKILAAKKSGVFLALGNTVQGGAGWYLSPHGQVFYFILDANGAYVCAAGPTTLNAYNRNVELQHRHVGKRNLAVSTIPSSGQIPTQTVGISSSQLIKWEGVGEDSLSMGGGAGSVTTDEDTLYVERVTEKLFVAVPIDQTFGK